MTVIGAIFTSLVVARMGTRTMEVSSLTEITRTGTVAVSDPGYLRDAGDVAACLSRLFSRRIAGRC